MRTKLTAILIIGTMLALASFAGDAHVVSGKIKDEKGHPLPGANLIVVGTGMGASTNLSGEYSIRNLPSGTYQFRVSMIGYETTSQEITVVGDQEVSFSLLPRAYQSQPVIITASRTHQKLQDSPVTTSVIEAEQIAERNFLSADEAIRFIGGVSMNDDQVSIRNSTGYAKGVGSRILVMIDGVPILSGDSGEIKWDALPIGQIKQVEVVKSAGSALYGSNAMGGVINFITKDATEKATYRILSEIGIWDKPAYEAWEWSDETRHFHRLSVEHARTVGEWGIIATLDEKQDMSFLQNNNYYRGQFFCKAMRGFNHTSNLNFMFNAAYEDRGSPFEWKSQAEALECDSAKLDDRVWSTKIQSNIIYNGSNDGGKKVWNTKAYLIYSGWRDALSDGKGGHDNHYSMTHKLGLDGQLTLVPFDDHRFTTGSDLSFVTLDANIFGKRSGFGGALFAQDEINTFDPLVATLGIRGDVFRVNRSDDGSYDGETYGQINPKIGVVYHVTEDFALRSNFGSGYRIPSMAELFTEVNAAGIIRVQPNPYLRAEQVYSAEAGMNLISRRQMVDIAVFKNWYTDMIEPVAVVGNQVEFVNINDANVSGIETTIKWNMGEIGRYVVAEPIAKALECTDFTMNYMFTRAINVTESEKQDKTVLLTYRPEHSFTVSASVDYWKHGSVTVDARYKSKTKLGLYADDPTADQRIIDLAHNLKFGKCNLQLKVSNLLNWNYIEIDRNLAPIRSYSASISVGL